MAVGRYSPRNSGETVEEAPRDYDIASPKEVRKMYTEPLRSAIILPNLKVTHVGSGVFTATERGNITDIRDRHLEELLSHKYNSVLVISIPTKDNPSQKLVLTLDVADVRAAERFLVELETALEESTGKPIIRFISMRYTENGAIIARFRGSGIELLPSWAEKSLSDDSIPRATGEEQTIVDAVQKYANLKRETKDEAAASIKEILRKAEKPMTLNAILKLSSNPISAPDARNLLFDLIQQGSIVSTERGLYFHPPELRDLSWLERDSVQ